jgi:hypothetical protein
MKERVNKSDHFGLIMIYLTPKDTGRGHEYIRLKQNI